MTRHPVIFLFVTLSLFASCSRAEEDTPGTGLLPDTIEVRDAWVRPAAGGMMGGAYLTILNGTEAADTLTGITSDAAMMTEVHETYEMGEEMSGMRPAGTLTIDGHSILEMSPGGFHIMLMQLNRDLAPGDSVSLTLHFAQNGPVEIWVPVAEQQQGQE